MRILILMVLLMIPLVQAIDECQRVQEPSEIPCFIFSTYKPSSGCIEQIRIYNSSGGLIQNQTWEDNTPFCVTTWNITTTDTFNYNSSIESGTIVVEAQDKMASTGVIIFLVLLNIGLFLLPKFIQFSQNKVLNHLMSKIVIIAAVMFLAFNITIIVSIADNAGLGINSSLFLYQRIALWTVYISLIFLFYNMVVSTLKMWKLQKTNRRMGEDE